MEFEVGTVSYRWSVFCPSIYDLSVKHTGSEIIFYSYGAYGLI